MKTYSLPDLAYGYDDLEPLYSGKLLRLHHQKHHAGYVKGANKTLERLEDARDSGDYSMLNQLQKSLAFHVSGHVMHSIFWDCMTPNGGGEPPEPLAKRISANFGSVERAKAQFSEAAKSLQGSGWVALSWEPAGQTLIIEQVHDHQGNTGSSTMPLLVLDCWEHAYYLQYLNEKGKWIEAFWELVNWEGIAERFNAAAQVGPPQGIER